MKNVVVIGAGPAGLTAAYELLHQKPGEYKVTVLEETGEFGGISRTVRHEGNRMDIGGHRFFSKDQRVTDWWIDRLPLQGALPKDDRLLHRQSPLQPGGPDPETDDVVMLVRNRISRIYYKGKFFDYPISLKWQTIRNMGFFTTLRAGFSYLWSVVRKLPEDSLENFYINRFGRVLYSMFFEGYTEKLWGRPPKDISADWGAQRVKGLSIKAVLKDMFGKAFGRKKNAEVETSLIEQFYYPKFGPGQMWELVATEVEKAGGTIRKYTRAVGFETDEANNIKRVQVAEHDLLEWLDADIVFSSMPVKDLVAGLPDVPAPKAEIGAGLPYRDFVTVGLLVNKLALANGTAVPTLGNIVPDCWIYVQDTTVKLGRIQIFNNWSPYMVKDVEDTVWVGLEYFCAEGDAFWNMEAEDCITFAAGELRAIGVLAEESVILTAHRERVKKAYPAYFDTYAQMDELIGWLNRYPNLYCIGRNGQHRYNNMDHSMATAFEAVHSVTSGSGDKTALWNVNTDKAYHEQKEGQQQQPNARK